MNINNTILQLLEAENVLSTTKTKPIVDAIKNRKKMSFMYFGPQKPKKDSVKPGKRIDIEPVALGLSKRGNLIVRAWIDSPPSVSKKGTAKTHWRTFMVGRMRDIKISDEVFNSKRPQYKEGDDRSMTVTYVTSDWTKTPKVKKVTKPATIKPKVEPKKKVEPILPEPVVEPKKELPQPKPKTKPSKTPEVKPEVKPTKEPAAKPEVKPTEPVAKPTEPVAKPTKEPVVKPEGKPSKTPEVKPETKPSTEPTKEPEQDEMEPLMGLSEQILRIKTLMFS